jgi:hypothetical protein
LKHIVIISTEVILTISDVKSIITIGFKIKDKPQVASMESLIGDFFIIGHTITNSPRVSIAREVPIENVFKDRYLIS